MMFDSSPASGVSRMSSHPTTVREWSPRRAAGPEPEGCPNQYRVSGERGNLLLCRVGENEGEL